MNRLCSFSLFGVLLLALPVQAQVIQQAIKNCREESNGRCISCVAPYIASPDTEECVAPFPPNCETASLINGKISCASCVADFDMTADGSRCLPRNPPNAGQQIEIAVPAVFCPIDSSLECTWTAEGRICRISSSNTPCIVPADRDPSCTWDSTNKQICRPPVIPNPVPAPVVECPLSSPVECIWGVTGRRCTISGTSTPCTLPAGRDVSCVWDGSSKQICRPPQTFPNGKLETVPEIRPPVIGR